MPDEPPFSDGLGHLQIAQAIAARHPAGAVLAHTVPEMTQFQYQGLEQRSPRLCIRKVASRRAACRLLLLDPERGIINAGNISDPNSVYVM